VNFIRINPNPITEADGLKICTPPTVTDTGRTGVCGADSAAPPGAARMLARTLVIDKVVGLKLGADDYVTRPFDFAELLVRIEALLRRCRTEPRPPKGTFCFGSIQVNIRQAEVIRHGELVALSAREFKLLCYFIEHRGALLSREELMRHVWEYDAVACTRTVDIHVAWLRQKLEDNPKFPQWIQTVRGLGYKFTA
jgi:two-component system alkaline phosphatase synthesis response regulator PhoP